MESVLGIDTSSEQIRSQYLNCQVASRKWWSTRRRRLSSSQHPNKVRWEAIKIRTWFCFCVSAGLHQDLQREKSARQSLRSKLRQVRQSGGGGDPDPWSGHKNSMDPWSGQKNFIPLFAATYLRQFKREKRLRRKIEEDLELESKKCSYFEDAIKSLQKWVVRKADEISSVLTIK